MNSIPNLSFILDAWHNVFLMNSVLRSYAIQCIQYTILPLYSLLSFALALALFLSLALAASKEIKFMAKLSITSNDKRTRYRQRWNGSIPNYTHTLSLLLLFQFQLVVRSSIWARAHFRYSPPKEEKPTKMENGEQEIAIIMAT